MLFKEQVNQKRLILADPKFGIAKDEMSAFTTDPLRHTISLPSTLASAINTILLAHDNQQAFPEDNNEEAWFVRTFPDFLVPDKF